MVNSRLFELVFPGRPRWMTGRIQAAGSGWRGANHRTRGRVRSPPAFLIPACHFDIHGGIVAHLGTKQKPTVGFSARFFLEGSGTALVALGQGVAAARNPKKEKKRTAKCKIVWPKPPFFCKRGRKKGLFFCQTSGVISRKPRRPLRWRNLRRFLRSAFFDEKPGVCHSMSPSSPPKPEPCNWNHRGTRLNGSRRPTGKGVGLRA